MSFLAEAERAAPRGRSHWGSQGHGTEHAGHGFVLSLLQDFASGTSTGTGTGNEARAGRNHARLRAPRRPSPGP
jgi:hypothetical protein